MTLSLNNPLFYRGYKIYLSQGHSKYCFVHINYNGPDPDPKHHDRRLGECDTIEECISEINELESNPF